MEAKYYLYKSMYRSLSLKVKSWEPKQGSGFVNWDIHTMGNQAWETTAVQLCREHGKHFYSTHPPHSHLRNYAHHTRRKRKRDLSIHVQSRLLIPNFLKKWKRKWTATTTTQIILGF
jgi:hypothetical protein